MYQWPPRGTCRRTGERFVCPPGVLMTATGFEGAEVRAVEEAHVGRGARQAHLDNRASRLLTQVPEVELHDGLTRTAARPCRMHGASEREVASSGSDTPEGPPNATSLLTGIVTGKRHADGAALIRSELACVFHEGRSTRSLNSRKCLSCKGKLVLRQSNNPNRKALRR